jgi:L-alanine-DL-glutamate epimerase-like enolase superfamily enzyme
LCCLVVLVHTDQGVTGESLLYAFNSAQLAVLASAVSALAAGVVGEDPRYTQRLWQRLWRASSGSGRAGVTIVAISALDRACWDIAGQVLDEPLYRIFGAYRDEVPVYASGLWLSQSTDGIVADAHDFIHAGFGGIKMRVGKARIADDVDRVRAVRDAIGPDVPLMVDANKRLTVEHAIRLGRRLEDLNLAWFEEPLPEHDLVGSSRVAAALDTPIASGESVYTRYGFRALVQARGADVLMPDLARVGGYTEMLKVVHLAEAYDLPISPHHHPYESIHVLASAPNGTLLEYVPWFDALYAARPEVRDGHMKVPQGPGTGIRIDPEAVERFRTG